MERKTYRAKEISEIFGIGLSTVWNLTKEKKLTPIKVSSRITLFDAEEVRNLLMHKND